MSEILSFHNDEAGYDSWCRLHGPDGYVLTKSGRDWTLHNATCQAITEAGDGKLNTSSPKLCSTDRARLVREARERSGGRMPIQSCGQCGS